MNPLVRPDPGLYIWTIVTFLVLVALLAKFAWRPLLKALEERQESIRKSLDDARQAKQGARAPARRVGADSGHGPVGGRVDPVAAPRPTPTASGKS
jgi:F0F1-type ATP synthase membrane subunit b/b'